MFLMHSFPFIFILTSTVDEFMLSSRAAISSSRLGMSLRSRTLTQVGLPTIRDNTHKLSPWVSLSLFQNTSCSFSFAMQKKTTTEPKLSSMRDSIPIQHLPPNSIASIKNGGLIFVKELNARVGTLVSIHTVDAGVLPAVVLRSTPRGILAGLFGDEHLVHRGDLVSLPSSISANDPVQGSKTDKESFDFDADEGVWPRIPTGPATLGRVMSPSGTILDYSFADVLPTEHKTGKTGASAPASPISREYAYLTRAPTKSAQSLVSASPNMKLPITAYAQPTDGSQLFTGLKFFDSLHPLRRGTRIGVVGPTRETLSELAVEVMGAIALQNGPLKEFSQLPRGFEHVESRTISSTSAPTVMVYAIIGQTHAYAKKVIDGLRKAGALAYTTVIFADMNGPVAEQYFALQAAQVAANAWRSRGMHCFCVIDDIAAHAKAVDMVLRTSSDGGKDAEASPLPLNVGAQQASVLDGFAHLTTSFGGGSSTALSLFVSDSDDRNIPVFDARRAAASLSALHAASDSILKVDKAKQNSGIFPPFTVTPSTQNMRYLYPAMRPLIQSLNQLLLQARDASTTAKFGGELGFEADEDQTVLIEWKKKLAILLTQERGTFTPLPVQYLLLLAATRPTLLSGFPVENTYILEQFLLDLAGEEGDLMERLKNEIMVSAITNGPLPADHVNGLSFKLGFQLEKFLDEAMYEFSMQFGEPIEDGRRV